MMGKLASRASYALRSVGAYGLLTRLHQSRLLKQLIFKAPKETRFSALPPEARTRIEAIRAALLTDHPALASYWTKG